MNSARVLIAGIGNIFLGDDAFGVEVVRELQRGPCPPGVDIRDFGVRGHDLALALTSGYAAAILVDAAPRGRPPGSIFALELDGVPAAPASGPPGGHSLDPLAVLQLAAQFGGPVPKLILVGCEPAVLECEAGVLGLSPAASAAVPGAIELIGTLLSGLLPPKQTVQLEENFSATQRI